MRPRCLSIHAAYACEHVGACCTASWPIPVEPASLLRLQARGLVSQARSEIRPLDPPANGLTLALARAADDACVFFDREDGRLCRIHRDGGASLLPSACRAFPRVALRDGRGLSITLSHYCPTAARLLLTAGDILIVDAPDSLSLGGAVEGLDAAAVLPQLLRPGMLTDLEGYSRWEQEAIAVLNDRRVTAATALAVIRAATRETCEWRPGSETLAERASRAFACAPDILQRGASAPRAGRELHAASADVPRLDHATKAFLAAHLFASWAAYQHGGLFAVVEAVEAASALVGSGHPDEASFLDAVRNADLRLRHS
jgi:Fe-S-cluster containining protein